LVVAEAHRDKKIITLRVVKVHPVLDFRKLRLEADSGLVVAGVQVVVGVVLALRVKAFRVLALAVVVLVLLVQAMPEQMVYSG
jgi:hypothetical protein